MAEKNETVVGEDERLQRELAALREEYDRLKMEQVRADQELRSLERQLEDEERAAREEYGTADPEKLRTLLAEKRAENSRLVEEYRTHISEVRAGLDAIGRDEGEGQA